MTPPATPGRALWRPARLAGLLGFVLGGGWAAWQVLHGTWVREFQAGDGSALGERLTALAQRATVEAVGFGTLGAAAGLVAWLLTPARGGEDRAERVAARTLTGFAAVVMWTTSGTWLANALLPLLEAPALLALDLAGIALGFAGLELVHALARRLPWAGPLPPPATALANGALWIGAAVVAQEQLFDSGPRTPLRLALAGGAGVGALALTPLLARAAAAPVAVVRARLAAGRLLPRPVGLAVAALFAVAALTTALGLELSALPSEIEFADLETGDVDGPSVVLVTVDTLRADHLGCYGYERPTSPFLDSLAAAGTRCADASAPASWTKPSTATILTGLYPSRHGALHHGSRLQLPEGEATLAEAFREAGYATAGFVTNPNVKAVFDFDRGFQEYFDSFVEDTVTLAAIRGSFFGRMLMALSRHQFNWKYENDVRQMNRFIEPWLAKNRDKPFFLYLHYIDPHTPYHPPAEYREEFVRSAGLALHNERKRRVGLDLYDAEIRYTDDGLRELVEEMERLGVWENTLFALTSDHGEEFFEHGYDGHGFSLFQPVVGVPLLLHGPGVPSGRVVEHPVQVLDLPATLLDLAGAARGPIEGAVEGLAEGPAELGDGRSFRALIEGAPAADPVGEAGAAFVFLENEFGMGHDENRSFVFRGLRQGRFKLVRTEANKYFPRDATVDGGLALYDLEADPDEEVNLVRDPRYAELVEELLERLHAHTDFLRREGLRGAEAAPLTPDLEEDLRALGYL